MFTLNKGAKPEVYNFKKIPLIGQSGNFDIRGADVRDVDFREYPLETMARAQFDSFTKFPSSEKLPAGFDPAEVMEHGKDPGVGIRDLHKLGLNGSGIRVAIIDQPLSTGHVEYKDKLLHYEKIGYEDSPAQMHGAAVASLLVGETLGVAPGAELIYFAARHTRPNKNSTRGYEPYFDNYILALEKIRGMNEALAQKDKIKVVSVSWAEWVEQSQDVRNLIKRMQDEGIFVLGCAGVSLTHGLSFQGLNRDISKDPNDVASYGKGMFWSHRDERGAFSDKTLLVPMDNRTTASQGGDDAYVHYSDGGMSWATPYVAGLYAIAKQIDADVAPRAFWNAALATGAPLSEDGHVWGKIAQPASLMERVKSNLGAKHKIEMVRAARE